MTRATSADVAKWLRDETTEHLSLMTKLRNRLAATMDTDVNENGTPSRDFCRALQRYQHVFALLLTEERERIKLRLMMGKAGEEMLSDEEYEQEMKSLAAESLGTLPLDVLHRELERRGASAPMLVEREEEDD